jgi:hypothetical protein
VALPVPVFEQMMVFAAGVVAMSCATGIITSWIKSRNPKGLNRELLARLDEIAERAARLDNAVDAMALEVERISEGQRFTTKLLAERKRAEP